MAGPGRPPGVLKRPAGARAGGPAEAKGTVAKGSGHMDPASLEEFFQFLQCQLCLEAREVLKEELPLKDPGAAALWDHYFTFVKPNLGANERWVPYHTAFGVHEFFLLEQVHHRQAKVWDEKQRFMAIFVFRAHCKRDFFNEAQLPFMLKESFWKNPQAMFKEGGPIEKAMLKYRRDTGKPLLTLCFRMIPERILQDDNANLVRSILLRTQRLLECAEKIWPVVQDRNTGAAEKFTKISNILQDGKGLGETWAKMLTVCIDLAFPKLGLLESQCDVGVGAQAPLRCLLPDGGPPEPREALKRLNSAVNGSGGRSSKYFWEFLPAVEQAARQKNKDLKLVCAQLDTKAHKLSAVTLQVQLCEYRQFRNSLARSKYGLERDESMKLPEKEHRLRAEEYFEYDEKNKKLTAAVPVGDKRVPVEVSLKATNGSRRTAERVAAICFGKLQDGESKQAVDSFRDRLYSECKRLGKDVPEGSPAWQQCKVTLKHSSPLVSFTHQAGDGTKTSFQTTVAAAGNSIMEAERIARLCFAKFEVGSSKDAVLEFRKAQYEKVSSTNQAAAGEPATKRRRTGGG